MSSTLSTFYLFFLSCYIIRENAIVINFLRFSRDVVSIEKFTILCKIDSHLINYSALKSVSTAIPLSFIQGS